LPQQARHSDDDRALSLKDRVVRFGDQALRLGMRGAPWWWEFESELKRRLALEMLLRRMFAVMPQTV
jgi:N-glycosylase/DNA lyase